MSKRVRHISYSKIIESLESVAEPFNNTSLPSSKTSPQILQGLTLQSHETSPYNYIPFGGGILLAAAFGWSNKRRAKKSADFEVSEWKKDVGIDDVSLDSKPV